MALVVPAGVSNSEYSLNDYYGETPPPEYSLNDYYGETPPPPPSSVSSARTRDFPLPGYVEDSAETEETTPPPSYISCTIPPPVYEDLYPSARQDRMPKTLARTHFKSKWVKNLFFLAYAALATTLIAIGTKHKILGTCEERAFLLIWCIATGVMIYIGLLFGLSEKLRKKLTRFKTLSPLLFYLLAVFAISWVIGGVVTSWDELEWNAGQCNPEVVRATFSSCVICFVSAIGYCCVLA